MTRRKRILTAHKRYQLQHLVPGPNRLVEVIHVDRTGDDARGETRIHVVCERCSKELLKLRKIDTSSYLRFNRNYSNGTFGGGKHFKRSTTVAVWVRTHVGPFEKLNCEKCGQKNEP